MEWFVVITDPAAAAQVLANVPGRTHHYEHIDEVLGGPGQHSMFGTLDEVRWRNTRKVTAPAFNMANVRRYYAGSAGAAGELLTRLEAEQRALGAVDVEPHLQRLMLRAVLEGMFEVPDARLVPGFDALASNIVLLMDEANRHITNPIRGAFYATPFAPLLSKHVARCRSALKQIRAFHTNTAARILTRPAPADDNTLLWACLHRLRHPHKGRRLSPSELHPEVGMYTTAGFDTTTSTLGWCLYAAALYPEHQEEVAAELHAARVFGPGAVVEAKPEPADQGSGGGSGGSGPALALDARRLPGLDDLARLPSLNAFVNEVMRMYPAAATAANRVSAEPVRVLGHTLPPRTVLWPLMYGIHMSEANWDQPEVFRPDRWIEDKRAAFARTADAGGSSAGGSAAPGAGAGAGEAGGAEAAGSVRRFLPFGDGPKNCVGQNFAMAMVRAVLALLLSRYRMSLHPDMGCPPDTAALTQLAVVTKLRRLRLTFELRD